MTKIQIAFGVALAALAAGSMPAQTVKLLYTFTGGNAALPAAVTPAQGRDGDLYGTTAGQGGSSYASHHLCAGD